MKIHRKIIAQNEEVINLSIIENDLYIVTSKKIYKGLLVSNKTVTR